MVTPWYRTALERVNLLRFLNTIFGIQPLNEGLVNGSKYSFVGCVFLVGQSVAFVYVERKAFAITRSILNQLQPILQAMSQFNRIIVYVVLIAAVLECFARFKALNTFRQNLDTFDSYLKRNQVNVSAIRDRIVVIKFLVSIATIATISVSVYSVILYDNIYHDVHPYTVYNILFYRSCFVLIISRICVNLYEIYTRFNSYCSMLTTLDIENTPTLGLHWT